MKLNSARFKQFSPSKNKLVLPSTSVFREFLYHEIFIQNSNLIISVEGKPGVGKSISSSGILERWSHSINKTFTVDYNIVHSIPELMSRIANLEDRFNKGEKIRGTALQFDDAGVSMDSRSWYDTMHKVLNDSLEVMRYLGIVLFITVPSRSRLDKKMRDLAHGYIAIKKKVEGRYTECKFYELKTHWRKDEEIPTKLRIGHKGLQFRIETLIVRPPSVKLRHDYEKWMMSFKGDIIRKSNAKLNKSSEKPLEERKALTEKQRQIYYLIKNNNSPKMIAKQLGISEAGVSTHIRNIRVRGWI